MPVEKEDCDCCMNTIDVCPECGSYKITTIDNPLTPRPRNLVVYNKEEKQTYKSVCYDCGWSEEVLVTVELLDE